MDSEPLLTTRVQTFDMDELLAFRRIEFTDDQRHGGDHSTHGQTQARHAFVTVAEPDVVHAGLLDGGRLRRVLRYRRIVKRRGHAKALVAVARSMLVITWHLINDPDASYQELGADWHQRHLNPARRTRDLVRQLQALGHQVTLETVSA
ncbi:hypothetical protein [Streptomyces bottropensis]|uniref:hypothetical protein n=1 Tax=Streptomyces bottropensis TaxID=42235 RepID=UPI00367CAD1E